MPYGQLKVYQDPSLMMSTLTYDVHLKYGISEHMLLSAKFPQDVLAEIAKSMAKAIERDIFELLLTSSLAPESLQGISTYAQAQDQKYNVLAQAYPNGYPASWNDPNVNPCAEIQHAAEAIKASQSPTFPAFEAPQAHGVLETLQKVIPGLKDAKASCPANKKCGEGPYHDKPLSTVIMHLNDQHKWTREKIADWLETLDCDLSFQEAQPQVGGMVKVQDEVNDHALDAMKYALMTAPLLDPKQAHKIINPS